MTELAETILGPGPAVPAARLMVGTCRAAAKQIERTANWCADLFQRSQLLRGKVATDVCPLWHHCLHQLRPRKLAALTTVHKLLSSIGPDGTDGGPSVFFKSETQGSIHLATGPS